MPTQKLDPEKITVIVDTREQLPYDMSPYRVERRKLRTGDYSLKHFDTRIAVERKSLADLIGSLTRESFKEELERLRGYQSHAVIVEANLSDLEFKSWRGQLTPNQVIGMVTGWDEAGIKFIWAGNRSVAELHCKRFLFRFAQRRHKELFAYGEEAFRQEQQAHAQ